MARREEELDIKRREYQQKERERMQLLLKGMNMSSQFESGETMQYSEKPL